MEPIVFELKQRPYSREDSQVVRISGQNYANVKNIAYMTRQSLTAVVDRLLTEALSNVQLVETPLYEMTMKE